MPTRNNILLRKRTIPKRVELPGAFYAKYERIKIANFPPSVSVRRFNTRIDPRRQRWQIGQETTIGLKKQ